jgi:integrase
MSTQRRQHGEGSLFFSEASQRWYGFVDAGRDGAGRRRRIKVSGRTKAEARTKLADVRRDLDAGLPAGDQRLTVGELLEEWLEHLPASVQSDNTRIVHEWAVRRHLVPALGHRRLRELTADDVESLLHSMADRRMSRASLARVLNVLRRALRAAERRGRVARNVADLVDVPAASVRRSRSLSVDQARAVLSAASGDRLEALYVTGLMLGLRPGELLGLPWSAVDFDSGTVRVTQSLLREGKLLVIGQTKTPHSRRVLMMPAPVVEALRQHELTQQQERRSASIWTETGLVFTTSVGTAIDPSNLRRGFARLTEAAGIGHWHPHELRHSAASIMSAAGVRLEVIADVLGHDGVRTTSAVYRHLLEPTIRGAVAPMEQLFGEHE